MSEVLSESAANAKSGEANELRSQEWLIRFGGKKSKQKRGSSAAAVKIILIKSNYRRDYNDGL